MALGASHRLQDGVLAVETMTRFALAVLALASGVYTYLGVRSLLDGSPTAVFFAAIIYSASVSVAIYAFWSYMARFYPHVIGASSRGAMMGVMALGCAMIIAMSSWLNAAALAGSAALEQHLAETVQDYTADLDQAHQNALAAQSLLPDIQRTSERFSRLAEDERQNGALTGTTGSGSVVQLLSQMSSQLSELESGIIASRERVATLFDQGRAHLATMRTLVSAPGAVAPRSDDFSAEVVALSGVITSLEQTSIAPSVKRAAEDLSLGFIAPVADGRAADLVDRGWAVWNIAYRRIGNGGEWPAMFDDVVTAVDRLAMIADDHPIDRSQVVAVGHSAGGHLVGWLAGGRDAVAAAAGVDPVVRPTLAVSLAGILDLAAAEAAGIGSDVIRSLVGASPSVDVERAAVTSPIAMLPADIPVVAVHGTADALVPRSQSEDYVAAARAIGSPAEHLVVEGADHMDMIDPTQEVWRQTVEVIDRLAGR